MTDAQLSAKSRTAQALLDHVERSPCPACGREPWTKRKARIYVNERRFEADCPCGVTLEAAVEREP